MICPQCGKPLKKKWKNCASCGHDVPQNVPVQHVPVPNTDLSNITARINRKFLIITNLAFFLVPNILFAVTQISFDQTGLVTQLQFPFGWFVNITSTNGVITFSSWFLTQNPAYAGITLGLLALYTILLIVNYDTYARLRRENRLDQLFTVNFKTYFMPVLIFLLVGFLSSLYPITINPSFVVPVGIYVGLPYFFLKERQLHVSFKFLEENLPGIRAYMDTIKAWTSQVGENSTGPIPYASEFNGRKHANVKKDLALCIKVADKGMKSEILGELKTYVGELKAFEKTLKQEEDVQKVLREQKELAEELDSLQRRLEEGAIAGLEKEITAAGKTVSIVAERVGKYGSKTSRRPPRQLQRNTAICPPSCPSSRGQRQRMPSSGRSGTGSRGTR